MQLRVSTGTIDCFIAGCGIINRPHGATKLPWGHLKASKLPLGCYFFKASRISVRRSTSLGPAGAFSTAASFLAEASFTLVT